MPSGWPIREILSYLQYESETLTPFPKKVSSEAWLLQRVNKDRPPVELLEPTHEAEKGKVESDPWDFLSRSSLLDWLVHL